MKNSYVPKTTKGVLDGGRVTSFKTLKKGEEIDVSMPLHNTKVVAYTGTTLILSLTAASYEDGLVAIGLIREQVSEDQFSIVEKEAYCKVEVISATMISNRYRVYIKCTGVLAFESQYSNGSTVVTTCGSDDRLELGYVRDTYPHNGSYKYSKIVCAVDYSKMGTNQTWDLRSYSDNSCSSMSGKTEYLLAYNDDWTVIGPSINEPTKVFETELIKRFNSIIFYLVFYLEDLNDGRNYSTLISPEDALSWMEKNVVVVCKNMKTIHDSDERQPQGRRNKRPVPHKMPKLRKYGYVVDRYPERYYRKGIRDARMGYWNTRSCRRIFANSNYVVLDWKR